MKIESQKIRNIAIIAHVDHGKTTLVDELLKCAGTYRENESTSERVMDSMDIERERGITISAKNCSVMWKDYKINIVDTPGHADFGGEVERALMMVDGAILLVDCAEGPLPQTRFVLKKALENNKKIIVAVNKIDRKDARVKEVLDEIYDLFINLGATDEQIEFPILYCIGRDGIAKNTLEEEGKSLEPMFDLIINTIPAPSVDAKKPFQMLVSNLGYSDFVGRLAIGKIFNGEVKKNQSLVVLKEEDQKINFKCTKLQVYNGLKIVDTDEVASGDIAIIAGLEDVQIGDTIADATTPNKIFCPHIDQPTLSMIFSVNNSRYAGQEGKVIQIQKLKDRLALEALKNVALKVENNPDNPETIIVKGRGEFQMVILIETLRREGNEFIVSRPQILFKEKEGVRLEPIEEVLVDCEEYFVGVVTEKLSKRKGIMTSMVNNGSGRVRLEFTIPSRGLLGYRTEFLTDTKGTGILNTLFSGYEPYRGDFPVRKTGSLVSDRDGEAVSYALYHLEPRGILFVRPNEKVYKGMVIGEYNKENDLHVNPCKGKKLSNMRTAGKDDNIILTPVQPMTIEKAIEFIVDDEVVEVTPENIRCRKKIV